MTLSVLEYYRNLVDKAAAGLRGLTPIVKEVILWVKCYQTASGATETSFVKGRVNRFDKHNLSSYVKKLPQPPQPISQQPSTSRQNPPSTKRLRLAESSDDG
jgi:hypothetical protein